MPNVMNTEIGDRTRIVGLDDFPHNWLFIEYLLRTLWTSIRSQQRKNNIKILTIPTKISTLAQKLSIIYMKNI